MWLHVTQGSEIISKLFYITVFYYYLFIYFVLFYHIILYFIFKIIYFTCNHSLRQGRTALTTYVVTWLSDAKFALTMVL